MATKFFDAPLSEFIVHKIAENEDGEASGVLYNYYLRIHPRGKALIMRVTEDGLEIKFADAGRGEAQWANRKTLEYKNYDRLEV